MIINVTYACLSTANDFTREHGIYNGACMERPIYMNACT